MQASRAEPKNEHPYDHLQLFTIQSSPSEDPAGNQIYHENDERRRQQSTENIAVSRHMLSAVIAFLALSFVTVVATLILTIRMMPTGASETKGMAEVKQQLIELRHEIKASKVNQTGEEVRWCKVNKLPVCFEAKGNRFGRFYVPEGRLAAIKLVHLYGYVSCHVHGPSFWSYWGCGDNPSMELHTQVNAVITDSSNYILLPPIQFQKISNLKWYRVPGYNSLSPELVLPSFSSPEKVHSNQELRVWFGENLVNLSEGDNGGTVCADVYALFV